MIIKVEQKHIDAGIRENCEKCPIARALMEQVRGANYVTVDGGEIAVAVIDYGEWDHVWRTPDSAIAFITKFDAGYAVEPFEFELGEEKERSW